MIVRGNDILSMQVTWSIQFELKLYVFSATIFSQPCACKNKKS